MYVFYNFYRRVFNSIRCMVRSEWLYFIFISFFEQISPAFPGFMSSALLQDQRIHNSVFCWEMSVYFPAHKWEFCHALGRQLNHNRSP